VILGACFWHRRFESLQTCPLGGAALPVEHGATGFALSCKNDTVVIQSKQEPDNLGSSEAGVLDMVIAL